MELLNIAAAIKLSHQSDALIKEGKAQSDLADALYKVNCCFQDCFADMLPMLEQAGIAYQAKANDVRYFWKGFYIEFEKEGNKLKMDYSLETAQGKPGWRYEHVPYDSNKPAYGTMVIGQWPKDRFILWVAGFFFND